MLTPSDVFELFSDQSVRRHGETYVSRESAADLIAVCEENDLAVIGLEAYIVETDGVLALPSLIADYSDRGVLAWAAYRATCNSSALEFVRELPRKVGLAVTVTLRSADEQ